MYFRIYPTKSNTIFQYYKKANNVYNLDAWTSTINTGANPVMELQDGAGESKLLFSFDIPDWLKNKLATYTFKSNLKLFDAGTLFAPGINLKNVTLSSFTDDFAEGDGYSFLKGKAKVGVSNFINRLDATPWTGTTFTNILTYHLNTINEDLIFDVSNTIDTFVTANNSSPKFALNITTPARDLNIYAKYIHSQNTRTVFKPFLEFFIDDEVQDKHNLLTGGEVNRLYLINQTQQDFNGTLTVDATLEDGTVLNPSITQADTGVYYIEITPAIPKNNLKNEYVEVLWKIDGEVQYKELILVQSPNQIFNTKPYDLRNLYYYVITPYTHNLIRQGDVAPFDVISQIRGYGNILDNNYEYKVLSADGFEMVPWMPVSVYKDKMYFLINTSYFYPELQYEVFLRNKTSQWSRTSHLTYKFKVTQDAQSHLRDLNTSPYYSREQFFSK